MTVPRAALVLGVAGPQVDAIRWLAAHGYRVTGCGWRREGPGLREVDGFDLVDIKDADGVIELARRRQARFIAHIGSDLAMISASLAADALGLPSPVPSDVVVRFADKGDVRRRLATAGLDDLRFARARRFEDLREWTTFPAVIKPVDGQGQRGVFRCASRSDLERSFSAALAASRLGRVLVEEWIEGPEVSAHLFLDAGTPIFVAVSDRIVAASFDGGVPRAHVMPSEVLDTVGYATVSELVIAAASALGLHSGPVYAQLKVAPRGPRIVELSPRLDGCHLWQMVRHATGVDLLSATLRVYEGKRPEFEPMHDVRPCRLGILSDTAGVPFTRVRHPEPPGAVRVEHYYEEGEVIPDSGSPVEKVGYFVEEEPCASQ